MPLTGRAQEHREVAACLLNRGLLVAARDELLQWLAQVESSGDPQLMIIPLNGLAKVAVTRGESEAALAYLERAKALGESPGAQWADKLRLYLNLSMVYSDLGRLDDAERYLQACQQLDVDSDPNLALTYWLNRSALHWRRQEWAQTLEASDRAYALHEEVGDRARACKVLTNRGIAHMELGHLDEAERDLRATLATDADAMDPSERAYAFAEMGRLHFRRGDYPAALDAGREALAALLTDVAFLDKEEVARVSRLFGTIFATLGQRNLALKYLNRSAAYYSQLGLRAEWQRSTEAIGQVLSGPVRPARSQLQAEVHQLDFLTAVLDLTDDLESIDPYLRGHSERVASMAQLLGEASGLSADDLVTLSYAARLHDAGMIAVDADLISRDGPLTEAERRRVAMHTTIGEEMLRPYGLPEAGLAAVRHHHEQYGGGGSPDGLAGEAIPLLARIITVVDVYDALTSERVYRGAMNHARAMEELQSMSGQVLDPVLVERFRALHDI